MFTRFFVFGGLTTLTRMSAIYTLGLPPGEYRLNLLGVIAGKILGYIIQEFFS